MNSKYGFTKMSIQELENWLANLHIARTVLTIQEHHTYSPSYALFKGSNHFELQKSMKDYHVNHNGWSDIGQHFTTFPDGSVMTGRSLELSPACILGQNANAICIENLGNFDKGADSMTSAQRETIIGLTAALCKRFNRAVNSNNIVYHHWFDLSTGQRNNGIRNNKSCPGTAFFGGNKVADCEANFLPLVAVLVNPQNNPPTAQKYVVVTAISLNVRVQPATSAAKATDRQPATFGAILRVYQEKDGWYKISSSQQHWVYGNYTQPVKKATVTADTLNVRTGPGTTFPKGGSFVKGQEIFVITEQNNWCKISMGEKWVSKDFLSFE